jgi:hypothetical protein
VEPGKDQAVGVGYQPRIGRALKRGFQSAYDSLGVVLLGSALWIIAAVLLAAGGVGLAGMLVERARGSGRLLLGLLSGVGMAGVGTGPITAALFDHTRRLMAFDYPAWWEIGTSLARLWQRGLALAGLQVSISLVLAVDALYFLGQNSMLARLGGFLCLYPLLFWVGAALIQWPLAVWRQDDPIRAVVRKSFLLLLDNLGYLFLFSVILAAASYVCWRTVIGLVLAWAGLAAFLQTAALRELLPKYELLPVEKDDLIEE